MAREFGRVRKLRKKANGSWIYELDLRPYGRTTRLQVAQGHYISLTKKIAQELLASIRSEITKGKHPAVASAPFVPALPYRVVDRLPAWLEMMEHRVHAGERSPTYLRELLRYARPDGHFSYLADLLPNEITYGALEDWLTWLSVERGLGPKTRANVLGAFQSFMGWLRKREEIERLPTFPEKPRSNYVPTTISTDAQERILDEIDEPFRGPFIAAVELLLRPGEIRALNVADFRDGKLTVAHAMKGPNTDAPRMGTKTGDFRVLLVGDRLAAWMETHVDRTPARLQEPLFVNPRSNHSRNHEGRWLADALRAEWKRAASAAGLPEIKMYEGTKHSTATALRGAGVALDVIQAAAGHKDPRSTERYAQLAPTAVVEALRRRTIAG